MVEAVTARAREVERRFEAALGAGEITMEALFSADYRPIPGVAPAQFMTDFVPLTDRILPDLLEGVYALGDFLEYAVVINKDGFLPTHNKKFSNPPRLDDPVWNAANARNRRFFSDRVGLTAGRSTAPVLIQSYRRDMGGGKFVTMKDISAPITVRGRHWGGFRMGYKPAALKSALVRAA